MLRVVVQPGTVASVSVAGSPADGTELDVDVVLCATGYSGCRLTYKPTLTVGFFSFNTDATQCLPRRIGPLRRRFHGELYDGSR